jgi:hypothetical protein
MQKGCMPGPDACRFDVACKHACHAWPIIHLHDNIICMTDILGLHLSRSIAVCTQQVININKKLLCLHWYVSYYPAVVNDERMHVIVSCLTIRSSRKTVKATTFFFELSYHFADRVDRCVKVGGSINRAHVMLSPCHRACMVHRPWLCFSRFAKLQVKAYLLFKHS